MLSLTVLVSEDISKCGNYVTDDKSLRGEKKKKLGKMHTHIHTAES